MPYGLHFCLAPRRAPDGAAILEKLNMAAIRLNVNPKHKT